MLSAKINGHSVYVQEPTVSILQKGMFHTPQRIYALNVEISRHLSCIQGPLVYPYLVPFMLQVGLLWDTISSKWPLILVEGKMVGRI